LNLNPPCALHKVSLGAQRFIRDASADFAHSVDHSCHKLFPFVVVIFDCQG